MADGSCDSTSSCSSMASSMASCYSSASSLSSTSNSSESGSSPSGFSTPSSSSSSMASFYSALSSPSTPSDGTGSEPSDGAAKITRPSDPAQTDAAVRNIVAEQGFISVRLMREYYQAPMFSPPPAERSDTAARESEQADRDEQATDPGRAFVENARRLYGAANDKSPAPDRAAARDDPGTMNDAGRPYGVGDKVAFNEERDAESVGISPSTGLFDAQGNPLSVERYRVYVGPMYDGQGRLAATGCEDGIAAMPLAQCAPTENRESPPDGITPSSESVAQAFPVNLGTAVEARGLPPLAGSTAASILNPSPEKPTAENGYQPIEGFFQQRSRLAAQGMSDPNASTLDRVVNLALGTAIAPMAMAEGVATGVLNAPNTLIRAGQEISFAANATKTEDRVEYGLAAVRDTAFGTLGILGAIVGARPSVSGAATTETVATRAAGAADEAAASEVGTNSVLRSPSELMGVEPASAELLAAIGNKRSLVVTQPGSDELRMLDYFGAEASVGGVNNSSIILRENPSKAAVLEEFLHGTQARLGVIDRLGTSGLGSAETHVKDFMIRHQDMLGLGADDVRILQTLRDKGL